MHRNRNHSISQLFLFLSIIFQLGLSQSQDAFSFIVTADMRYFAGPKYQTSQYFLGTCEAIEEIGKGEFMISPGDVDPPWYVRSTIDKVLGENYIWYPVIGNHEVEKKKNVKWLQEWGRGEIPYLKRKGPEFSEETTYSFDFGNAHFVVINMYYRGNANFRISADVSDPLYEWLKDDLEANDKPITFVFGHAPIVVIPDMDTGRTRHLGKTLDSKTENNHRFQELLRNNNVTAYFCGHTHSASYANINGLWQFDAGHCRGIGDNGTPSTFLKVTIKDSDSTVEFYRADSRGENYKLTKSVVIQ